jgi:hypothetical protein
MKIKKYILFASLFFFVLLFSCERDVSTLEPASYPTFPEVFIDGFNNGLDYQAFENSKLDAFDVDNRVKYEGTSSMIITVPSAGDPTGWFAGGVFVSPPRDLSGFNALTFWAKASQVATLGLLGFGNDNTETSEYQTWLENTTVTTSWQKFVIPIPNPSKLTIEDGLFQYSFGADEAGNGYTVWLDEVQFENLGTIAHPQAILEERTIFSFVGDTIDIGDIVVRASGTDVQVKASAAYLDFFTDNDQVLSIVDNNIIVSSPGTAKITAKLGDLDAFGEITVEVGNLTTAPIPQFPAEDVISLFSDAYTDVQIDSWNPGWEYSTTKLVELNLGNDNIKQYNQLNFVGIVFTSQTLDLSEMTHFYVNLLTPDPSALPAAIRIEIIDFGADNAFGGNDDSAHMITVNANTNPPLVTDEWIQLDIPISQLTGLNSVKNVAQIVLSSADNQFPNTVFLDNLLFHK